MSNIKSLVKELHQKKNLDKNLPLCKNETIRIYREYTGIELLFHSYMLMEELAEDAYELSTDEKKMNQQVFYTLENISQNQGVQDEIITSMQEIRDNIIKKMDVFTAYTDELIGYEYVMNRIELKFSKDETWKENLRELDEEEFLRKLMTFIFSSEDQAAIMDRLRVIMGQLPVRMTKQKFFDRVEDAILLYKDSEKSSLEGFIYMLETSGMVYRKTKEMEKISPFYEVLEEMEQCDFENISEKEYEDLFGKLSQSAERIHSITDYYYTMQKIVNCILAMMTCNQYTEQCTERDKQCQASLLQVCKGDLQEDILRPWEGKIETYAMDTSYIEAILPEFQDLYDTEFCNDIKRIANLLSDSLFIDLSKEETGELVDSGFIQSQTKRLIALLQEKMEHVSRPVKRAMMSQILEKLPNFLKSTQEIQDYIQTSLFQCQKEEEKATVISLLQEIMSE